MNDNKKATIDVLLSVLVWILLVMIPIGAYYFLTGELAIDSIIHTKPGKAIFFLSMSAIAYAVMWTLQFHFDNSRFLKFKNQQYWNPFISCNNKWKDGKKENGEKFLGSSSVFAFTTDAFHLFQFIFLNSIIFALSIFTEMTPHWCFDFLILRAFFGTYFTCFFSRILINKS